jgi:TatA/E family protein of Tat protein translocase
VITDADLLFIAIVALLLFGNKLPAMMRKLGNNLSEFKRAMEQTREHARKSAARSEAKNAEEPPHAQDSAPVPESPAVSPPPQSRDGGT